MIGFLMQALLWLVLILAGLFLLANGGLRLAAWSGGGGIIQVRDGKAYRVKLLHWLPRFIGWLRRSPILAITIGRTICVAGADCWPALHAHEWKHVEEDERYRGLENELYYTRALITGHGYSPDHWAEKEAIVFANAHAAEFKHLRVVVAPRAPLVPV